MNGKDNFFGDLINLYERKIFVYRLLLVIFVGLIIYLVPHHFKSKPKEVPPPAPAPDNWMEEPEELRGKVHLPHRDEVMAIMEKLSYSGLQALVKPTVNVSIDFDHATWTLQNIHQFDAQGNVMLDEGRYGLCGELSDYVYRKLVTIFGDKYTFLFSRVTDVGYFLNPRSSHTVIQIKNKENPNEIFIVDPAFARYGTLEDFGNYVFHQTIERMQFLKDQAFEVPSATPVLINRHSIIDLGVEGTDGKFDRNNFTIALSATKQYYFTEKYIFAIRLKDGKIQKFENTILADWLIERQKYMKLRNKIVYWFARNDQIPDTPENIEVMRDLFQMPDTDENNKIIRNLLISKPE